MQLTPADTYLLGFQARFFWAILLSSNGMNLFPRVAVLMHDDSFGFYMATHVPSNKIGQIESNPYVTIDLAPDNDSTPVLAHCTARISNNITEKTLLWHDDWKHVGFTGPTDEKLRIIFITVHSLDHENNHYEGVPLDSHSITLRPPPALPQPDRFNPEDGNKIIREAILKHPIAHLFTWNGTQHSDRMMQTLWLDKVGPYHITMINTRKVSQIKINPHVALHFELRDSSRQVVVQAVAHVSTDLTTKKLIPTDILTKHNLTDLTSDSWGIITYSISTVIVHDIPDGVTEYHFPPTPDKTEL